MRPARSAKIIATLGPATSSEARIAELAEAGANVFRLNFSHGTHADHRDRYDTIRRVEASLGRPIAVLLDLQGPKLRVGDFADSSAHLTPGAAFRVDLDPSLGDVNRVCLPHREIFDVLKPGTRLLLDDGRIHLDVEECGDDYANTRVAVGGDLSNHKGVNVPNAVLPLSPFTPKDREDLEFGIELGVDWVAISFVQRPEDIEEVAAQVNGRAPIMTKLEKPSAVSDENLARIIELSQGIMVARGDLGVELPPERVPPLQKRIVKACRDAGRPVVVATQMLESMVTAPVPTRAETSDVATAVYDGADAVMLSAETAVGEYPVEAVAMMSRIIREVEGDELYRRLLDASVSDSRPEVADAVSNALRHMASTLDLAATMTFTASGYSGIRTSRERPKAPLITVTPSVRTARKLALVWGCEPIVGREIHDVDEMVELASDLVVDSGIATPGDLVAIVAGVPFGRAGTTNLLRLVRIHSNDTRPQRG